MNEKIIELAEQAGIHPANFESDADLSGPLKKFAELIIQECIAVHEDDYGVDIIGNVLKKHFGVEE